MGCRQCLPLSVVQLKGKHYRKPHCRNGAVDTFRPSLVLNIFSILYCCWFKPDSSKTIKYPYLPATAAVAAEDCRQFAGCRQECSLCPSSQKSYYRCADQRKLRLSLYLGYRHALNTMLYIFYKYIFTWFITETVYVCILKNI
jgi:hypothetical protein